MTVVDAPLEVERPAFEPLPRVGIRTPTDALLTLPSWYLDTTKRAFQLNDVLASLERREKAAIGEFQLLSKVPFDGDGRAQREINRFTKRLEMTCEDRASARFRIVIFGAVFGWKKTPLRQFMLMTVTGAGEYRGELQLHATPCDPRIGQRIGTVIPMYAGSPGVQKGETIAACVDSVCDQAMKDPRIWLSGRESILAQAFCSEPELLKASNTAASNLAVLLRGLHRPKTVEEATLARDAITRVAAAAVMARSRHFFSGRRSNALSIVPGIASRAAAHVARLEGRPGFKFTKDQNTGIRILVHAWSQPIPSAHMVNGDVGTGKSFTFLVPAIAALEAGKNVAVMAPTSILADQLARVIVDNFPGVPVLRVETGKKVKETASRLATQRCIVVGTPGLTSFAEKAKWTPDVLIIDEEHKFSTEVREAMVGDHTHVVHASATPIPRSLAIALYAGMNQIILRDVPVAKDLRTKLYLGDEQRSEMNRAINAALREGKKVAFVYPAVQETPPKEVDENAQQVAAPPPAADPDAPPAPPPRVIGNVKNAFAKLHEKFPHKVAMLHGQMHEEEIRSEIAALQSGQKTIAVASSLIEVGIDIPSLDVMVVSDPDHFGAAQLHQLRGRLARRGGVGQFMMYLNAPEATIEPRTLRRLRTLEQTSDGFELAEIDMDDRGFGDTAGDQQSGRVFMIVRGITLRPRDFLELSAPEAPVHTLADLTEDPDLVALEETVGQLTLI